MTRQQSTFKEYVARINRVIDYITNNLDRQLNVSELSRIACFSEFHFHRIFSMVVGVSPNIYVRRLRLEKAAAMLQVNPNLSITDLALNYGFSSTANFSKPLDLTSTKALPSSG